MRKNLVSTGLLVKHGFKCIFVSDKVVIIKNEIFVGKGYLTEGLFNLNVMVVENNNNISASSYLLESNDLWHVSLNAKNQNVKYVWNVSMLNILISQLKGIQIL